MKKQLYVIISNILGLDINEINEKLLFSEVKEWDSLHHLLMLEQIEKEFGVDLPIEEAAEADSVEKLLKLIER